VDYDRAKTPGDNDLDAMQDRYIAVTPLDFDRTDHGLLQQFRAHWQ
jgi:hypothetical protein